ncbi:MAG: stage III sporulation protein AG [Bacillota bacterium]
MLDYLGKLLGLKPGQLKVSSRIILLLLLGLALILAGTLFNRPKPSSSEPTASDTPQTVTVAGALDDPKGYAEYEKYLNAELERVLSLIDGAGRVTVSVTLESGPRYDYAMNENTTERNTEEKDKSGGSRLITEIVRSLQMVLTRQGTGPEKPVLRQIERPVVRGVLVVAPGAADSRVRARLTEAVQTFLSIPAHRVQVVPKSNGG